MNEIDSSDRSGMDLAMFALFFFAFVFTAGAVLMLAKGAAVAGGCVLGIPVLYFLAQQKMKE